MIFVVDKYNRQAIKDINDLYKSIGINQFKIIRRGSKFNVLSVDEYTEIATKLAKNQTQGYLQFDDTGEWQKQSEKFIIVNGSMNM